MKENKYKREEELIQHYDSNLKYYSPVSDEKYFRQVFKKFNIKIDQKSRVLDIGCGDGRVFNYVKQASSYVGVDYSVKRIEKASNLYNMFDNCNFIQSCVREYVNNTNINFDIVTSFEFFEHIIEPQCIIETILNKCDKVKIVASLPVNLPYKAHLSVWKNIDEVRSSLSPNQIYMDDNNRHFICLWNN